MQDLNININKNNFECQFKAILDHFRNSINNDHRKVNHLHYNLHILSAMQKTRIKKNVMLRSAECFQYQN